MLREIMLAGIAVSLLTPTRVGASMSVGNRRLRVEYRDEDGGLQVSDGHSGIVFARVEKFAPEGAKVLRATRTWRAFTGESLEWSGADGLWRQVFVDADAPFVFFTDTLTVSGVPAVTNRVSGPTITLDLGVAAGALTSLGTGGLLAPDKNPGSYMWAAVAEPATRRGVVAGWLTTDRGSGVVRMDVTNGAVRLLPHADYGRLPLAPGRSETLETFALGLFDDARLGLEAYADQIAKVYEIRLPPMPVVHCTWYVDRASNENVITARTAFAAHALKPFGLDVMQIDDGWQLGRSKNGPDKVFIGHDPKGPYPSGMKPVADAIRGAGMKAGIWLIPFAGTFDDPWFADKREWFARRPDGSPFDTRWGGTCFDLTRADTQAYLKTVIRTLTRDWGYTYLKMDGLYTGASVNLNYVCDAFREDEFGQAVLADPHVTQLQMMRNSLKLVRETAGKEVFLLGCCAPQNMRSAGAAFGLVDAMRIGPDNGANWSGILRGPEFGARQYFLHRRVWYNDPDPLYVRGALSLEHARVICSWVTLSGQMNSSSEEYAKLPPERLDLLKRTMPSHVATARPVDLFDKRIPGIWLTSDAATADHPRRDIVGLYNWGDAEESIDEPLAKLGLSAEGEWMAFDFWGNTLTAPLRERLRQTLAPQSCLVLALRPVLDRPQLISTSRHITQGMVDVISERWDARTRTLSGVSQTVANDPYELRVLTRVRSGATVGAVVSAAITGANGYEMTVYPGDGVVARPDDAYAHANTPDAPMTRLFEPVTEEGLVRVTFISGSGGPVAWRVTFSDQPAPTFAPQAVTFTVPKVPRLDAVPPNPDVRLDSLKPLKTAVGWGSFKVGTALNGPH